MSDDVIVRICGPDGLCSVCVGEDRTGTDGCGSYFRAGGLRECDGWFGGGHHSGCEQVALSGVEPYADDPASVRMRDLALDRADRVTGSELTGGAS